MSKKLLSNKKGVELTMQTVIIAVIVLIVLVVLIVIFLKGSNGFMLGVTGCEDRSGACVSDAQSCTSSGGSIYRLGKCTDGVCCIPENSILKDNQNVE